MGKNLGYFSYHARGGSRTSSWEGHRLNNRALCAREIFGHAHFCEDHAHIVAANETNSPRFFIVQTGF